MTQPAYIDIPSPGPNGATRRVIEAIANHFFLSPDDLLSKDRHKSTALARMIAMYVLREHQKPRPSFPELGRQFGNRDHSTVISAVRRVVSLAVDDEHIRGAIEVGKLALAVTDAGSELRRLTLMAERDELLRKARALDEKLRAGAAE